MPLDASLSDNPVVLQGTVRELLETVEQLDRKLAAAEHRIEHLLRRLYGQRSERFDPGQPTLFDQFPPPPDPPAVQPTDPVAPESPKKKKHTPHGRKPLPPHLPRRQKIHEPTEAEKTCPCCQQPRVQIGSETSEQLEYQPASLFVVEHIRPTLACPACLKKAELSQAAPVVESAPTQPAVDEPARTESPLEAWLPPVLPEIPIEVPPGVLIMTVPMPKQPIPKGLPGPGLLAHIITSKFADHLPLYRQEAIFARQGVEVSRKTMSDWLAVCARLLTPLYELMTQRVLRSRVINNDDTTVPVLAPKTGKTKTGRLWVSVGDCLNRYIVFNYTPDRSRDGPNTFFKSYKGFLQVDAYTGYEELFVGGNIREAACWAHARRKFFEAKTSDEARSHLMLGMIRALYKVEENAAELTDEAEIVRYRRTHARPLLVKIKKWLKENKVHVLPKSPMAEAIGYALNNWRALNRYTLFGFLAIDNNLAERELRAVAIGRKNWMFAGSDAAGQTAAILYSFVSTCKHLGIEPWAYLRDVLTRLPELPPERLEELLPDVWAKDQRKQIEASAMEAPKV